MLAGGAVARTAGWAVLPCATSSGEPDRLRLDSPGCLPGTRRLPGEVCAAGHWHVLTLPVSRSRIR